MRGLRFLPVLAVILLGMSVASVFAAQYQIDVPILGTSGVPALTGDQFTGILTVLYADGMPVVLETNKVTLQLCGTFNMTLTQDRTSGYNPLVLNQNLTYTCIRQEVTLKQTAPGAYAYSFIPPSSLTGTITITVRAGVLADDNGRIFPSVDTEIGTYATPGLASSAAAGQVLPASPPAEPTQSNKVVRQAVALPQPTQPSPLVGIVAAVTAILLVAGVILLLPSRRR